MKIYISTSLRSRMLFMFRCRAWKTLIALALTLAVYNINAQSADSIADETTDGGGISVPTSWSAGPNLPTALVRSVGIYFPTNGLFYAMGGRSADTAGSDLTHPLEFNPATNTWATKVGTYPDNQVNNMACGILTVGGTPQIYCVGGSAAGATVATARVFSYNPATDTITALTAADNWPGNMGTILPGGFAVVANKLYLIGGYNIGNASTGQTWQFDPNAAVGSRWLQRLDYPVTKSYIPVAAIGGLIYTGGGTDISGGGTVIADSANSYKYDPVANTWTAILNIPRATGETRALALNNQMWVLGGGRTAPNPSTQVDIYNPDRNTWSTGLPFVTPRRNFPADTDGTRVWLGGGYTTDGLTAQNTMEIFRVPVAQSAVSRKSHGGTPFDVPLPLTATTGVESRRGGGAGFNTHQVVVTFGATVTVGGVNVASADGMAMAAQSVSGAVVTVDLTSVTDAQTLAITLTNVNDGTSTGDVSIPMGILRGDTNGDRFVNAGDALQTRNRSGQAADAINFRSDVNSDGFVNSGDTTVVRANSGASIP